MISCSILVLYHVYIHAEFHLYIYIYVCVCVHVYVYMCTCICIYMSTFVSVVSASWQQGSACHSHHLGHLTPKMCGLQHFYCLRTLPFFSELLRPSHGGHCHCHFKQGFCSQLSFNSSFKQFCSQLSFNSSFKQFYS